MAIFEDDPVLGQYVAHFPSLRSRLLLQGGVVYTVGYLILTVAFSQTNSDTASIFVIGGLALLGLAVGWYVMHFWNREVVLYTAGFSYREGSLMASILYSDIRAMRQRAEQMRYLGIIRYRRYRYTLETTEDETIILNNVYQRIEELGVRLERAINDALRPTVKQQLADGKRVPFGAVLVLSIVGLHAEERDLPWAEFTGYKVKDRQLVILANDFAWQSFPLSEIDNITLLLELLRVNQPER